VKDNLFFSVGSFWSPITRLVLYILSSGQSPPLLVPSYDRPIDRLYDRRQTYNGPTYEYFLKVFDGFDDDDAPICN